MRPHRVPHLLIAGFRPAFSPSARTCRITPRFGRGPGVRGQCPAGAPAWIFRLPRGARPGKWRASAEPFSLVERPGSLQAARGGRKIRARFTPVGRGAGEVDLVKPRADRPLPAWSEDLVHALEPGGAFPLHIHVRAA